jgi:SRSO17 transposase
VFAAYVSDKGHAFFDRRLYLPREWTDKPARLAAAHVPAAVSFATKPRIAVEMIGRAIEAGVPFAWVTADSVYGVGEVEMALRRAGKGYVLGVTGTSQFWSWGKQPAIVGTAEEIAATLPAFRYVRLSAGDGTKGPRMYDWAYLELADLDAEAEGYPGSHGIWTRGLLIRRSLADQDLAFFTTWGPPPTTMERLVRVEGHRWAIEDGFETTKTELGLDHNETRSWHGWHRHVSLVMLAFAIMAVLRHKAEALAAPQKSAAAAWCREWSDGPSRRSGASLAG